MALLYLKHVYEGVFPQKRHGAQLLTENCKKNYTRSIRENDKVTESVTFRNGVSLLDRTIIINLLEGVNFGEKVPNFVKLISLRSKLSRTTIQNRIRVGKWLVEAKDSSHTALTYRRGLISHSQVLKRIK